MAYSQKKGLAASIALVVLFLLAAGCAVYFLFGAVKANEAIAQIDAKKYMVMTAQKGAQYAIKGEPLTAEITESLDDTEYHTPLGFSIVSHSDLWTGQKLVEIYDELLKNGHGDEIGYLSKVILYPDEAEDSEVFDSAGECEDVPVDGDVYVDVRALIPSRLRYDTEPVVSDISLYYMDNYDDASEIAETLAHEYGHHYTMYYFMQDGEAVKNSEYYTLRDFENIDHAVFYDTAAEYFDNHMWDIYEIAAEDYVQFLGSPSAKQTMEYMDRYDLLDADMEEYNPDIEDTFVNVFPQENIFIPLADEVPGLRDYYYSFIGMENEYGSYLETANFGLQIEKKSSYGHRYYNITWTMVNTDPDALYTLVCCDSDGEVYWPVRTVYGNEEPIAKVGSPVVKRGNWIYWWPDGIPEEDRIFKLYLLLPDGRMLASEPFYVDF